jgi:hypothetical protein
MPLGLLLPSSVEPTEREQTMSTTPLSGRRVRVASSLDRRHLPLGQVSPLVRVRRNAEPSTLASVDTVSEAWASIRVWHVWLNLIGFVSLVIATTLLHFFPTVIGERSAARPTARAVVVCLESAPALVALAMPFGAEIVARAGAILVEAGAISLVIY